MRIAIVTGGVRMDGADFAETASNPLNQIPPRVSFSLSDKPNSICDSNAGLNYQKRAYTVLWIRITREWLVHCVKMMCDVPSENSQLIAGNLNLSCRRKTRTIYGRRHFTTLQRTILVNPNGIALAIWRVLWRNRKWASGIAMPKEGLMELSSVSAAIVKWILMDIACGELGQKWIYPIRNTEGFISLFFG